jgi:uncharacterized repeat protein (TIGR03943 family)
MTKALSRWLPGVTLIAWSSVLLYFFFSGRIAAFLHPSFRPGVLAAGVLLLLLGSGVAFLPRADDACCDTSECAHPLGRLTWGRILTFGILLLPVCAASMASADRFGAGAILNRGVISDAQGLVRAPVAASIAHQSTPPNEVATVQVVDLLYAAQDASLRADFENRKVELIGQLMPETVSNPNGRRFKLVRMLMLCCAADARPVAAIVEGAQEVALPEMAWVKVVGAATFPTEGGRRIAVIRAESVSVTSPPEETMLY